MMPETPPPSLAGRPALRAFLRVLLVTAVIPVLFAIGLQIPRHQQDPIMLTAVGLVGLIPAGAVGLGLWAFGCGDRRAALGYIVGAGVSFLIGGFAWVAATLEAM